MTREDLTRYHATFAEPLHVELPAGTVYNTDAPTQGLASLMILALFDRLGVREAETFEHIHGLIEATKRAFACATASSPIRTTSRMRLDRCLSRVSLLARR